MVCEYNCHLRILYTYVYIPMCIFEIYTVMVYLWYTRNIRINTPLYTSFFAQCDITQDGLLEDVEAAIEHSECIQGAVINTRIGKHEV